MKLPFVSDCEFEGNVDILGVATSTITGVPPFVIASNLMNANLNVEFLNSHDGPYYLDRVNHTGFQDMSTITGLTAALSGKEPVVTAGTSSQFYRGDKTWADFATTARAVVLTGLSIINAAITSADNFVGAFGKAQGQINNRHGGSVTTNYIPKSTGSFTFGNSSLSEQFGYIDSSVPLSVSTSYVKTDTAERGVLALHTSEVSDSFGFNLRIIGAATLANRVAAISILENNVGWGGTLALQDKGGNISIGSNAVAAYKVDIYGDVNLRSGYVLRLAGSSGSSGQFLKTAGSSQSWASLSTTDISNFSTNVLGQLLTGYTLGSNTSLTSSNSILTAFQNVQAQINAKFPMPEQLTNFNNGVGFKLIWTTDTATNTPSANYTAGIQFAHGGTSVDYINQLVFDINGKFYARTKYNGAWRGYEQFILQETISNYNLPVGSKFIASHSDTATSNSPDSTWTAGMQVSYAGNSLYQSQLVMSLNGGLYTRRQNAGTWDSWIEIAGKPWTAATYTPQSRTFTVNGTSGRVTSSAGAQSFAADRTVTLDLATSGITPGAYTKPTFDAYGRAVSGGSLSSGDVTTALGYTPVNPSGETWQAVLSRGNIANTPLVISTGAAGAGFGITSIEFKPTDYGTGKPSLFFLNTGENNKFRWYTYDGTTVGGGEMNFVIGSLKYNGDEIATRNWATPKTTTLTIGGVTKDLSTNQTWTYSSTDTWNDVLLRNQVASVQPIISIGSRASTWDYLIFKPTDYGTGKPYMAFRLEGGYNDRFVWYTYDGTSVGNGDLDFVITTLKHNGSLLATQSWVATNYNNGLTAYSWGNHASAGYLTSASVYGQHSLTGGGNAGNTTVYLNLVNDSGSPGNNKLYGTNGSGTKGWYDQPSGGGISGSGATYYNALWNSGATALTYGRIYDDKSSEIQVYAPMAVHNDLTTYAKLYAASAAIGGGITATSTIFQINSTTKGSMPYPPMTCSQKTAIASPDVGCTVMQTDTGTTAAGSSGYGSNGTGISPYCFNGTTWTRMT